MLVPKEEYRKTLLNDWELLKRKNLSLSQAIWDLSIFVQDRMKKNVIVTEIFRTPEMQKKYYGKNTKKVSPHQLWLAVDIRSEIYSRRELQDIASFLRSYDTYNRLPIMRYGASSSRTVLLHNIGKGMHFHIQYSGPRVQKIEFDEGTTIRV